MPFSIITEEHSTQFMTPLTTTKKAFFNEERESILMQAPVADKVKSIDFQNSQLYTQPLS